MPDATSELQPVSAKNPKTVGYPGPLAHILAWTFVGILAYLRNLLLCGPNAQRIVWPEVLMWMSCFVPAALLGTLIFQCEKQFPLGGRRWPRNASILAALGIVFAYVACQIATGICVGVQYLFSLPQTFPRPLWMVERGEL